MWQPTQAPSATVVTPLGRRITPPLRPAPEAGGQQIRVAPSAESSMSPLRRKDLLPSARAMRSREPQYTKARLSIRSTDAGR